MITSVGRHSIPWVVAGVKPHPVFAEIIQRLADKFRFSHRATYKYYK